MSESDGMRRVPAEIVEKVINGIPWLKDNPAAAALYNYVTLWLVQAYMFGEANGLNTAEVLGVFNATIEHHVDQFIPGELADRVSSTLGRTEADAAFDPNDYWSASRAIGDMAAQTLDLVLADDEAFGDFMKKATDSGAYNPEEDGTVH